MYLISWALFLKVDTSLVLITSISLKSVDVYQVWVYLISDFDLILVKGLRYLLSREIDACYLLSVVYKGQEKLFLLH